MCCICKGCDIYQQEDRESEEKDKREERKEREERAYMLYYWVLFPSPSPYPKQSVPI